MMTYRSALGVLVALVLALGGGVTPGWAQDAASTKAEIRQMLEKRDRQIKSLLRGADGSYTPEQRARLKELISGLIDFRAMARRALGPYWKDLSEKQREEFVSVFRDVVRAQSMTDLGVYNSEVTYEHIEVHGDSAFVRTRTEYQGRSTSVEYVLERREGEWRAEDIIIDGVSTAEGYARSFQNIIRRHGFEALMKSLRKKREEVTSKGESEG